MREFINVFFHNWSKSWREKEYKVIEVKLLNRNQKIVIGENLSDWAIEEIKARHYTQIILFADSNLSTYQGDLLRKLKYGLGIKTIVEIEPTEKSKSLESINIFLEECLEAGVDRKSCFLAVGGGIVGDLAGFLASVYMRGVEFVFIPTTLMAQGDSIINKVAISYKLLKNVLGSFSSPVFTVCDTTILKSLPLGEISLGMSEIIKHALIDSKSFVEYLEGVIQPDLENWNSYPWTEIIYRSLKVKAKLVSADPFDIKGSHKGLSYGHTFANVFEGLFGFSFRHGEAVALGMQLSGMISMKLGYLSESDFERQTRLLTRSRLNLNFPRDIDIDFCVNALRQDKISTNGEIALVLLNKIGKFSVQKDIDSKLVRQVLSSIHD